jgi:hypothetical protein
MLGNHGTDRVGVFHAQRGTRAHQKKVAPNAPKLEGTPELQALGEFPFIEAPDGFGVKR